MNLHDLIYNSQASADGPEEHELSGQPPLPRQTSSQAYSQCGTQDNTQPWNYYKTVFSDEDNDNNDDDSKSSSGDSKSHDKINHDGKRANRIDGGKSKSRYNTTLT